MKKHVPLVIILVTMLATITLVYVLAQDMAPSQEQSFHSKTITIQNPTPSYVALIGLISFALCFAGCIACFFLKKHKKWFGVPPLLAVLATPILILFSVMEHGGDLQDSALLTTPDGQEYHMLVSHFLQGSYLVLGRLKSKTRTEMVFENVAESPWEESMGYLTIVRPKGLASKTTDPNRAELFLTQNHVLLGSFDNSVYMAYDITNKVAYGQSSNGANDRHVRELSPFILLGPNDTPNEQDVKDLLGSNQFGGPEVSVIKADLQNPNPKVRELAAKSIDRMADHPTKLH